MADLQDFGKKIGGARKDLWAGRGIISSDLTEMNAMERKSNIKKENIWIRPDWVQVIADGTPQCVAYWQNLMRQSIPPRPPSDEEITQNRYVRIVGEIRDAVMAVREPHEIDSFYKDFLKPTYIGTDGRSRYVSIIPEAEGVVNNKVLRAAQSNARTMRRDAEKKLFGIAKDEKIYVATKSKLSIYEFDGEDVSLGLDDRYEKDTVLTIRGGFGKSFYYLRSPKEFSDISGWEQGKFFVLDEGSRKPLQINFNSRQEALDFIETFAREAQNAADTRGKEKGNGDGAHRKGAFTPPQLRHIERTGPNYRGIRSANGDLFLEDLKFRGGEFGNWLNHDDRQASLDMAYDALRDLARVLQIRPEDVSLGQSLAIAFGARGRGGSGAGAAHYETDRQVINLTKMSGAGCLAHEWGHALDHAIGISCGGIGLASEMPAKKDLPEIYQDLLSSLKYKTTIVDPTTLQAEQMPKIERSRRNLKNWIASVKPRDLPENLAEQWNAVTTQILEGASSFTGSEYLSLGRGAPVQTKPEIEMLSQIKKLATNCSIPRETKRQITMWAMDLARQEEDLRMARPVERRVKTDFYKGSIEFDGAYSRHGHGYWQSDCEMFARAFDCYVADKIRESGNKSDYLSAHADAFVMPGKDGNTIAAVPKGEERKLLNEKFDQLLAELKERGILHEYIEVPELLAPEKPKTAREMSAVHRTLEMDVPDKPLRYEQLSFDEMLMPAQHQAKTDTHSRNTLSR